MNTLNTLRGSGTLQDAGRNEAAVERERQPEVQAEHEALMRRLDQAEAVMSALCDRLGPVRAMRPMAVSANGPVQSRPDPSTDIGTRFRAAATSVERLIARTEEMLGDLEI